MSNEQNNNKKKDNKKDNIIFEKKTEESDKSMDSEELDRDLDDERENILIILKLSLEKGIFFHFTQNIKIENQQ